MEGKWGEVFTKYVFLESTLFYMTFHKKSLTLYTSSVNNPIGKLSMENLTNAYRFSILFAWISREPKKDFPIFFNRGFLGLVKTCFAKF
jgi:hypothetical protein